MTHDELVHFGYKWLKRRSTICFSDGLGTRVNEIPDIIGWRGRISTLVECKVSRSDFLSDGKKLHRRFPEVALGFYRYYLCPAELIQLDDLPEKWGLLWVKGRRIYMQLKSGVHEANQSAEVTFLVSMLRRVQIRLMDEELDDWVRIQNMRPGVNKKRKEGCHTGPSGKKEREEG